MKTYLVTYDLNAPGQNYNALYDAIKAQGTWWHCLDSTWMVASNLSSSQIRDNLMPHIDSNDKLLVVEQAKFNSAWTGFDKQCSDWLKANL